MAKLKKGKPLDAEEMRFLQSVNPQLYLQASREFQKSANWQSLPEDKYDKNQPAPFPDK